MNFKRVFPIIIISGLLFSCKLKSSLNHQVLNCTCSENQKDVSEEYLPENLYIFSNDIYVALCGNKTEDSLYSEFSFFNCKSQKLIEEYSDGAQSYKVDFKKDTLKITNLKRLPVGKNWEFSSTPMYYDFITLNSDSLTYVEAKIIFRNPKISEKKQTDFLDYIILNKDNGLQHDWAWEEIISKLELLTLVGNNRAKGILYNLENITNYKFDGAVLEQYKDAIATIELVNN
ncbi:MAG: hypothetical protein ACPGVD_04585 [Flavobacteriales bacterium]